jgi:hypothetical protein
MNRAMMTASDKIAAARAGEAMATETRLKRVKVAKGLTGLASVTIGDEAIESIIVPTIERVLQGQVIDGIPDMGITPHEGFEGKGLVRVLRSDGGIPYVLRRLGVEDELIGAALRFAGDFEKARIGGLTAGYDGAAGGRSGRGEPERWLEAIEELSLASRVLAADERVAVYSVVVFDRPLADVGQYLGSRLSKDKELWIILTKYVMRNALIKLVKHYDDRSFVLDRQRTERY